MIVYARELETAAGSSRAVVEEGFKWCPIRRWKIQSSGWTTRTICMQPTPEWTLRVLELAPENHQREIIRIFKEEVLQPKENVRPIPARLSNTQFPRDVSRPNRCAG